jgi:UDP-N-acetylbacillosamine N-acetyltransferase
MFRKAIVLGTGGHCRVVLAILRTQALHNEIGIVELGYPRPSEIIMGHAVLYTPEYLSTLACRKDVDVFLAIGDNSIREQWWKRVKKLDLATPCLISQDALIDSSVLMGEANVICSRAFVGPMVRIGNNNLINTGSVVEHEVIIGDSCHFAPSSTVAGRCRIGSYCFLGAGATIIDQIDIASKTTIGAGATVVKSIEQENGVYIGTPSQRRGS